MISRFLVILAACLVVGASAAGKPAWMENLLNQENEHRAMHGAAPLVMNEQLEKGAQAWADQSAEECLKPGRHSPPETRMMDGIEQGENLQWGSEEPVPKDIHAVGLRDAAGSADAWYKEVADYPWPAFTNQDLHGKQIFHFTQMVWQKSKLVGYGLGTRPGCDGYYVVARYWPGGNVIGQFDANVLPKNE